MTQKHEETPEDPTGDREFYRRCRATPEDHHEVNPRYFLFLPSSRDKEKHKGEDKVVKWVGPTPSCVGQCPEMGLVILNG